MSLPGHLHGMLRLKNWRVDPFRLLLSPPWPPPTAVAPVIPESQLLEEEKSPYYDPKRFYPAQLSEVLHGRYQIATKLGYGTSSTVWLARDLLQWRWSPERYVAIKINAADRQVERTAENELRITQLVSKADTRHEGWHFIRTLCDSFTIKGPCSDHICLVFEPLREPLWLLKTRFEGDCIPAELLKVMLHMMLHALDYLHQTCHTIHADLKPDNILVKFEDKSILERSAHDELENPLPQKKCADRTIYLSRNNYGQPSRITGLTSIVDFGFSVTGDGPHYGCIQAEPYRAPEVILDAGWNYSTDIWNLGVMLWDLMEDKILFEAVDPLKNDYDDLSHLALITAILGQPPSELLAKGRRTSMFYNSKGELKAAKVDATRLSLEGSVSKISGDDKAMFLKFVRRMLTWEPKDRSTAKELLDDPWIKLPMPAS